MKTLEQMAVDEIAHEAAKDAVEDTKGANDLLVTLAERAHSLLSEWPEASRDQQDALAQRLAMLEQFSAMAERVMNAALKLGEAEVALARFDEAASGRGETEH